MDHRVQGGVLRPGHRAPPAAQGGLFGRPLGIGEAPEAQIGQWLRGHESRRGTARGRLDHMHQGRSSVS